jgi:hypothetical protein
MEKRPHKNHGATLKKFHVSLDRFNCAGKSMMA